VCDIPDQAAHYNILGRKGFISDPALGWNRGNKYYYFYFYEIRVPKIGLLALFGSK
jgi:hypothetical protein